MPAFAACVLCGTPRSGSTLLCGMLAATGVAGRPNSFFRREDLAAWAGAWGLPDPDRIDAPGFDGAYLLAMRREGAAGTGVFGLRLMRASVAEATGRLSRALGTEPDLARGVEAAFGPTLWVHVSRRGHVAQAVSRVRAEQSGVWHVAPDGTVIEGARAARPLSCDRALISEVVAELRSDEASWRAFFDERGVEPLRLLYEDVAADPGAALAAILSALGLDPAVAARTPVGTARMADAESRRWVERFRREGGA